LGTVRLQPFDYLFRSSSIAPKIGVRVSQDLDRLIGKYIIQGGYCSVDRNASRLIRRDLQWRNPEQADELGE
jgi:hypothetical protein